jgi:hypothetical protein
LRADVQLVGVQRHLLNCLLVGFAFELFQEIDCNL